MFFLVLTFVLSVLYTGELQHNPLGTILSGLATTVVFLILGVVFQFLFFLVRRISNRVYMPGGWPDFVYYTARSAFILFCLAVGVMTLDHYFH